MSGSNEFRIDHLGIAMRSLEAALQFWHQRLGMPVALGETVAQERVNVAMLPAGDALIELLEPTGPGSSIAPASHPVRARGTGHGRQSGGRAAPRSLFDRR